MISQQVNVPTRNNLQSSPATSNAIRGAEQSGNIANQRFARTRWVRGLTWQLGGWQANGRHRSIGIAKSEQTSIAKIVVISRVWSSCLHSCQSWLDPWKKTQRAPRYRTRLPALPKQDKQATRALSTTCKLKQYDAKMVCYAGCNMWCICKIWQGMHEPGLNLEIQVCHWKDVMKSLENDIKNTGIGVTVWKWQAIQKWHRSAIYSK